VVAGGDTLVKGAGTVIHVIGTGGKNMRALEPGDTEYEYFVDRFAYSDLEAFGFGKFTVTSSQLSFRYVRSAGTAFTDAFTITKADSLSGASPSVADQYRGDGNTSPLNPSLFGHRSSSALVAVGP
jgi:hypothetical protein